MSSIAHRVIRSAGKSSSPTKKKEKNKTKKRKALDKHVDDVSIELVEKNKNASSSHKGDRRVARSVVRVNYFILSIGKIDAAAGEFSADFYLDLIWYDNILRPPSTKTKGGNCDTSIDWKEQWQPNIEFVNATEDNSKIFENWIATNIQDCPGITHEITYQTRIRGKFSSQMNLKTFPFDVQKLCIHIESGEYEACDLTLMKCTKKGSNVNVCKQIREEGLVEWELHDVKDSSNVVELEFDKSKYSRFQITFIVSRRVEFYMYKIIYPYVAIVIMSLSVFGMPIEDIGSRVGTTIAAALTATAFQLAAGSDLPKSPYLTSYDKFMTTSFVIIFLTCASNVLAFQIDESGGEDAARWLDIICGSALAGLLLVAFVDFAYCGYRRQYSADTNNDGVLSVPEYNRAIRTGSM
eukprot:g2115.t1